MAWKKQVNKPSVKRLIEGFSSTGHDIGSAISDLVDNSITHGQATKIGVEIDFLYDGRVRASVVDNGIGMNKQELFNSLKYGTDQEYDTRSLGKYGLGLKTASTAFCRKVVVISRAKEAKKTNIVFNDRDEMEREGEWFTNEGDQTDINDMELEVLNEFTNGGPGTLVVWEKVNKLLQYKNHQGSAAKKGLKRVRDEVASICSVLFHKFLDHEFKEAENIDLFVNQQQVKPWDPYLIPLSILLQEDEFVDEDSGGRFSCRGYLIPRETEISEESGKTILPLGKKSKLEHQGFYVYRNHRIIYYGDWLKTRSPEPHASYGRIELCFDQVLDEYFNLDFSKRNVTLNPIIFDELKKWSQGVVSESNKKARSGRNKKVNMAANAENSPHTTSNRNIEKHAGKIEKKDTTFEVSEGSENEATITNEKGQTVLRLGVSKPQNPSEIKVIRERNLRNGNLWEPHLIPPDNQNEKGIRGVRLNTDHSFYQKIYYPNLNADNQLVEGLDAIFYSLATVEHETTSEDNKDDLEDYRTDVSIALDRLVRHIEGPDEDDL